MSRTTKLAAVAAASAATVAQTASAATARPPWTGGSISANLTSPLTVSLANAQCTSGGLTGSVATGGALSFATAPISGCSATGVTNLSVTAENVTSWGGSLIESSTPTSTPHTNITGFQLRAVVPGLVNCLYGATVNATTGPYDSSTNTVVVTFNNAPINKLSASGILSGLCPNTVNFSGGYTFTGPGL